MNNLEFKKEIKKLKSDRGYYNAVLNTAIKSKKKPSPYTPEYYVIKNELEDIGISASIVFVNWEWSAIKFAIENSNKPF